MVINNLVLGFCYILVFIVVIIVFNFCVIVVYLVFNVFYFVVVVCNEFGFGLVFSSVECIFGGDVNYIGVVIMIYLKLDMLLLLLYYWWYN